MKKSIVFFKKISFNLLLIILFLACSPSHQKNIENKPPIKIENTHSIIFIDKSISLDPENEFTNKKYTHIFKDIVSHNIKIKGDKIDIYYVHENTSKAKVWSLKTKSEILTSDTLSANSTDVEIAKNKFNISLRKEKADFLNKCIESLNYLNESNSKTKTDIWSSLIVLNKLIDPNEKRKVVVYYLSDMIESMDGKDRRDFHKQLPKNKVEAENWAKQDFDLLKKQLDIEKFKNIEINIALPYPPSSTIKENNPNVTYYWQSLFSLFGVEREIEEI